MVSRPEVHAGEKLVAGEIREDGRGVRKGVAKLGRRRVELGVVDAHPNLVLLNGHDDRRSEAAGARDDDALLEKVVNSCLQGKLERRRETTRRTVAEVRS